MKKQMKMKKKREKKYDECERRTHENLLRDENRFHAKALRAHRASYDKVIMNGTLSPSLSLSFLHSKATNI